MKKNINLEFGLKYNLSDRLEKIKQAGFNGIFLLYSEDEERNNYIASETKRIGLEIETIHLPFKGCNDLWLDNPNGDAYMDLMIAGVKTAARYHIKTVIMHVIGGTKRPLYSEIGLQRVNKIIKVCEEFDVILALENVREVSHIKFIFDNIKSSKLKRCLDFGHINCFTKNVYDIDFESYRDLIICTHIHDNDGSYDQHMLPFYGNSDYQYIAKELKKINYQGPLTSEARIKENHMFTEDEFIINVYEALTKIEKYFGDENE